MPFPTVVASTDGNAQAAFQSACSAAGLQLGNLGGLSQVQLCLANLLDYDPTTSDVPAGNIVPGTFAANTASPTGAFTFLGNLTVGASTFVVTAATGEVVSTGAGVFKGAVGAHQTSAIVLMQDTAALSQLRCYGPDAATAGTLAIHLMASDGAPDVNALSFLATGAATFAGTVQVGAADGSSGLTVTGAGRSRSYLVSTESGGKSWYWETAGSGNYGSAAGTIKMVNGTDAITPFAITSAGAATFASTVTAAEFIVGNGQFFKAYRTSGGLLISLLGIESGTDRTMMTITGDYVIQNGSNTPLLTMTSAGAATFGFSLAITGALTGVQRIDIAGTSASVAASTISLGGITRTTIGANGGATALTALPLGYIDCYVAGVAAQIPYFNRGA